MRALAGGRYARYDEIDRRVQETVRHYRHGRPPRSIAKRLGVAPTTVWRYLRLAGVPKYQTAQRVANVSLLPRSPYWHLHTRFGVHEIVCGRKFCPACGRWRHLVDFPPERRRGGQPTPRCRACVNIGRAYYTRHETPERAADRRERQRIYYEGKRRAAGVPVSTARRRSVVDTREAVYLPVAPLRAELAKLHDGDFGALSRRSGVPERTIYRLRYTNGKVQIDVADKLAVALGTTSALLFGEAWHG